MAGIIITGGNNGGALTSVELIREDGTTCTLPELPAARRAHIQAGLVACGGDVDSSTGTTCDTFANGTWTPFHTLAARRYHMVSWASYLGEYASYPIGVLLMGGEWNNEWTTELLSSTTTTQFNRLTYDTK